jgi:hypothetical protein
MVWRKEICIVTVFFLGTNMVACDEAVSKAANECKLSFLAFVAVLPFN